MLDGKKRKGGNWQIDVFSGNEAPFPNLDTSLFNMRLNFSHDVSDHWGYRIFAEFEDFDSTDWAYDGIGVDGVDAVLTYGLVSPKYQVINLRAQAVQRSRSRRSKFRAPARSLRPRPRSHELLTAADPRDQARSSGRSRT